MAVGFARVTAVAWVVALSSVSLVGVGIVHAQEGIGAPSAFGSGGSGGPGSPPRPAVVPTAPNLTGLSAEQRAVAVKAYAAALVVAQRAGVMSGDAVRGALRDFVVANQVLAGEVVAAVISFSKEGAPGIAPNLSLTQLLADGVALGVRELQLTAATNPAAQVALQAVNQVFVDEGVSRGSAFGSQFAVTLNAAGGALLPPQLASETSPIAVVIPSLPSDPTNEISPT